MNSKILKIVVAIIAILGIIGFVMVARADEGTADMSRAASFMVNLAFFLLIVTAASAVILSIYSLLKNPEALKKTLLGIIVLAVLFSISYFAASELQVLGANGNIIEETGSVSKWSGAGINFSLILLLVGGVFFVVDLVKGLIKS